MNRFEDYSVSVWNSIGRNIHADGWTLDLPEHVEMILRVACDGARSLALRSVEEEFLDLRYSVGTRKILAQHAATVNRGN